MPAAAAARSLERIAIIERPVAERRSRATITPTRHTIASTSTPKITRGYASPFEIPMFQPSSVGLGTLRPSNPPVKLSRLNTKASIVTAAANVTTARLTPRNRNAGSPTTIPNGTAASDAKNGASGNPSPQVEVRCVSTNPLTPANAICASDTWPM